MYGWLLGVWLAFWIHFCCREKIMTEAELVSYSEFDYNPRYLKGLAAFVFYNVTWSLEFLIINNILSTETKWTDQEALWRVNIALVGCSSTLDSAFQTRSLQ